MMNLNPILNFSCDSRLILSPNEEELVFQLQLTGDWSGDPYFSFDCEHYQVHKTSFRCDCPSDATDDTLV